MNILLDTHVLIWALTNDPKISTEAREAIVDGKNLVFVSAATVWEITIKKASGKLSTPDNLLEEIGLHRFLELPVSFEHAQYVSTLPDFHKDPFDRIIIAQAKVEKLKLITADSIIAKYDLDLLKI